MNVTIGRLLSCASFVCATFSVPFAHATPGQPGTLDATWATSSPLGAGKVTTSLTAGDNLSRALALQPDGKVVVAGICVNGSTKDICAVRYNADGTLDAGFGSGGKVITAVGTGDDVANAVALQPDGKVVLAGGCFGATKTNFCAVRYNADGSLDNTFGSGGKAVAAFGTVSDVAYAMAVQPDGKLVLAGVCGVGSRNNVCALRFTAGGLLDTSFGGTGKVITTVGSVTDFAAALALQPDGKLVIAGNCVSASTNICALRYNADGSLDSTFGSAGKVVTPTTSGSELGYALVVQPDGKLVIAGSCYNGTNQVFCAVRYGDTGALDANFGSAGKAITVVGSNRSEALAVDLQPDGKLVLAGYCGFAPTEDFCALRYNNDGSPDTTFGSAGKVVTAIVPSYDIATAVAVQPDGKLLLGGSCETGSKYEFCALRYDGGPFAFQNCKPDIDGDGAFLATTDALIYARIAAGITGPAVVNGINFPAGAKRNTWPLIRNYLVTQCGMSTLP